VRKVTLAACAATSIEWYNFVIYLTAAALVFPKLFFPADISTTAGVLASFSTAAVGFLARPVGGVVFAHFGDKLGRKPILVIPLLTMGIATTLRRTLYGMLRMRAVVYPDGEVVAELDGAPRPPAGPTASAKESTCSSTYW
jgi:MFS family permease